ncbi:MAG: L,D-transpeptidase family protein [Candidatus Omnitrophota bacterium]
MFKKILVIVIAVGIISGGVFMVKKIIGNKPPVTSEGKVILRGNSSSQARELEASGDLLGARDIYQKLINESSNSNDISRLEKKVEELNIKLLFSSTLTPGSILYEIKPGDTLTKIAKLYKTTIDLIMKSNNLANANISPGRKVKVWNTAFSITVVKSQNRLMLKANEEVFKTYIVSTGSNNSTPIGNFKIINKLMNPTWFKAGAVVPAQSPENILGTRWLGIDVPSYGIHGTTMPGDLGKQVTAGCVRMANADVEELYTIVPVGTEVTIVD